MITIAPYRQLRVDGLGYDCAQYTGGLPGARIDAAPGRERVEFSVTQDSPGVPKTGVMRSEIAGFTLPRFGRWRMRVEFCVPKFWSQSCAAFSLSAVADADDLGIHNSPLSFIITGDTLQLIQRADPLATSTGPVDAATLGTAKLVEGRWHTIDLDMNLSWLSDGYVHATLDGKTRMAAHTGPNCYNDQTPPFPCFGVYWWGSTGDPMRMLCKTFEVA